MRCQEDNSETGYEDWQYSFVLYNRAVLPHNTTTKLLVFVFSFDLNNKLNNPIVGRVHRHRSGSVFKKGGPSHITCTYVQEKQLIKMPN